MNQSITGLNKNDYKVVLWIKLTLSLFFLFFNSSSFLLFATSSTRNTRSPDLLKFQGPSALQSTQPQSLPWRNFSQPRGLQSDDEERGERDCKIIPWSHRSWRSNFSFISLGLLLEDFLLLGPSSSAWASWAGRPSRSPDLPGVSRGPL